MDIENNRVKLVVAHQETEESNNGSIKTVNYYYLSR